MKPNSVRIIRCLEDENMLYDILLVNFLVYVLICYGALQAIVLVIAFVFGEAMENLASYFLLMNITTRVYWYILVCGYGYLGVSAITRRFGYCSAFIPFKNNNYGNDNDNSIPTVKKLK